jgi:hypothetical protein
VAWDFARDGETGDWVFTPHRDYSGRSGDDLTKQRIAIRMKIPRGSFIYDDDKSLGSRLYAVMQYTEERAQREVGEIVREALEGMEDIAIVNITTPEIVGEQLQVTVEYQPRSARGVTLDEILTTTLTLPLPASVGVLTA